MSDHALFSPSAAERWLECAGSVRLCKGIPRRESAAAEQGTRAHKCLEQYLKCAPEKAPKVRQFLIRQAQSGAANYDLEMIDHAEKSAKWIWEKAGGKEIYPEHRADLSHIDPDLWGTLDVAIPEYFGTLTIVDFKYGIHVAVDAERNSQLLTYAVAESHRHRNNFSHVELAIAQPRAAHPRGAFRTWKAPIEALKEWSATLRRGIRAARQPQAPLKAGKWCFFCDAKKICPAFTPEAVASVRKGFVDESRKEQFKQFLE